MQFSKGEADRQFVLSQCVILNFFSRYGVPIVGIVPIVSVPKVHLYYCMVLNWLGWASSNIPAFCGAIFESNTLKEPRSSQLYSALDLENQ